MPEEKEPYQISGKRNLMRWYIARLAAMEPGEVRHRIVESFKKVTWSLDRGGWANFIEIRDGTLTDFAFLRTALAPARAENIVSRILSGQLEYFGQSWPLADLAAWQAGRPPGAFWLRDPIGGGLWPGRDTFCFAVDFRTPHPSRGDVKYIWELNRLQFLHPVAAEIARTGNAALARWSFRLLESWANANPPFRGVNWTSGIELALRIVSIALLVSAARPKTLQPNELALVRRIIAAHGYWLHRFPSRFSSANNHLLAEGLGLFIAGSLVPDLKESRTWVDEGRTILETEALKQILPDGVGAEQSPSYQAAVMELLAFAAVVAAGTGAPLNPAVLDRLTMGADFLACLLDDSGRAPEIGDDDEMRIIGQPPDRESRYVASIVSAISGLTGRPGMAPAGCDPHLRDVLFGAPASISRLPDGMRVFPTGGYTIIRDEICGRALHLVFDHGPLGYLSLAAHGHADALSVWLSLDEQPIFVDAGTYLYFSDPPMRDHLRQTAAHNTLVLDGRSQSQVAGPFIWAKKSTARIVASSPWPSWSITGEHDGYISQFGVRHTRRLIKEERGFAIVDRLDGAIRPMPVALHFLCHPSLGIRSESGTLTVFRGEDALIEIMPPSKFKSDVVIGDQQHGRGVCSLRFGEIEPASLVILSGEMENAEVTTRFTIMPRNSGLLPDD